MKKNIIHYVYLVMLFHSLIYLPFNFIFLSYFKKYFLSGISFSLILKICLLLSSNSRFIMHSFIYLFIYF